MTLEQFQKKYHDYRTKNKAAALAECEKVNKELTDNTTVVVQEFLGEFCLMASDSVSFLKECGVI